MNHINENPAKFFHNNYPTSNFQHPRSEIKIHHPAPSFQLKVHIPFPYDSLTVYQLDGSCLAIMDRKVNSHKSYLLPWLFINIIVCSIVVKVIFVMLGEKTLQEVSWVLNFCCGRKNDDERTTCM